MILRGNLFTNIPSVLAEEVIQTLFSIENTDIERIISKGQKSPPGFWYDQDRNEFVLLLKGKAEIEFADGQIIKMRKGNYLLIKAHERQRVKKTSRIPQCIWLALHF